MSIAMLDFLHRRRISFALMAAAIALSLPIVADADSLVVIDLHDKSVDQIASVRNVLKDSGVIKAEIRTGGIGGDPDAFVFEPKGNVDIKRVLPPGYNQYTNIPRRDLTEIYVSDSDTSALQKRTGLQPIKPMSASCSSAIQLASSQGITGGEDPDVDQHAKAAIFAGVERACMGTLVSSINALDAAAPAWAKAEQISDVVGVLFSVSGGKKVPFCTALLYTSHHLVTARHCFFNPDIGSPNSRGQDLAEGNIYFALPRGDAQPIAVERASPASITNPHPFSYDEDVVLLDLAQSASFTPPPISFRDPIQGEELLVAGIANHASPNAAAPAVLLRYTTNAECRTLVVRDGCVRHDCQSGSGFSGAPMFAAPNDEETRNHTIRVAGVHLGPSIMGPCKNAATSTLGYEMTANEGLGASVAQSFIGVWLSSNISKQ